MSLTRDELLGMFSQLNAELTRLVAEGQAEEALWEAFERFVQKPSLAIDPRDRAWWWEQIYSAMEEHGLTELSQGRIAREFP